MEKRERSQDHTYLYIHRQMHSRHNFLLPLPSFLIFRPILRGTSIKRLGVRRKRDGGEVLKEPDEEERRFVVSELKVGTRSFKLAGTAKPPLGHEKKILYIYLLSKTYPWTSIEREEYERIGCEVLV